MENQEKIQQMHFLEQNLQAILMQKQAFQMELSEIDLSLKEIANSGEDIYKIIGQLMLKVQKNKIIEELNSKQSLVKSRIKNLEKQEENLSEQSKKIREEILKSNKK